MKKVLSAIGVLFLLFLGFILFKTLTFKSNQLTVSPKSYLQVGDSSITRLQEAIRFKTVSYDDTNKLDSTSFLSFQKFLTKAFPKTFKTVEVERVNKYSLILHWKGKTVANPLLMLAHQDVVPVEEGTLKSWAAAPFSGQVKDGFVYGRGAIDDKGSLMAILESVEALINEGYVPWTDIYFAFGHDEEASGKRGAVAIAKLFKERNIKPSMILDEGGIITTNKIPGVTKPVAVIGIAEKGYVTLDLQITIPGGHSSMPEKETALDDMAKAIVKLKENPFPPEMGYVLNSFLDYVGPEMPFISKMAMANRSIFKPLIFSTYSKSATGSAVIRTTTATTIFNSGIKENVVPGQAFATVNFRTQPGTTEADVIGYVKKIIANDKIEITARPGSSEPKQVADVRHPTFKSIQNTLNSLSKDLIVAPYLVLGATDARHFSGLTNQVFRFIPFTDPQGFHGINERISVEDYKKGIGFYYQFLKDWRL
ncbi:M20/M25/M40 family metallo-hydrolase [Dyadobacter psychrotolerans]|uniref:M20/M25/M40 family metallo-hydrolase n=1 Tax=Dyadobacter psychrotolerans TaxID=2541721 RepID=A0A4R5DEN5_9BACT|nr:M20/M25/M40 family metallo-hydrolase [Dyadobacter psychrotolerans]TDE12336.1 M20/M25/M40 family metallo-hydrolase [Dyadobacter psychrotolerans]